MSRILIQCVVVLYKCTFDRSRTLQTLAAICKQQPDVAQQLALLIYDNSPVSQKMHRERWSVGSTAYHHAPENRGLAAAYNFALMTAQEQAVEWLLLLDQDTSLTEEFFLELMATVTLPVQDKIHAIVPKLMQQGVLISPQQVGRLRNHNLPQTTSGVQREQITALNSAACLRVQAVSALGGFPPAYWLDYLDQIMFHRLHGAGGRVLILNILIEHQLSLRNLETEMTLGRYGNMLAAEWRFVRETSWGGGPTLHRVRLVRRALLYAVNLHNKSFASQTLRAAFA